MVVAALNCGDVFPSAGRGKMGRLDDRKEGRKGADFRAILEERLFQDTGSSSDDSRHTAKAMLERF